MRKLPLVLPLGAMALAYGALPVRADDKADINALYAKVSKAMKAKDMNTVVASGTPDFVSIEHGQKMTGQQAKEAMEAQFKTLKSIEELTIKITKLDVKGTTANAMSTFNMKATTLPGPDKKSHKLALSGTSKDILVKTKKGWLMKSMESIDSKAMMDGKAMDMGGGAPPPPKKKK